MQPENVNVLLISLPSNLSSGKGSKKKKKGRKTTKNLFRFEENLPFLCWFLFPLKYFFSNEDVKNSFKNVILYAHTLLKC